MHREGRGRGRGGEDTWRSGGIGGSDSERERRVPKGVESQGAAASRAALEEDDTVGRRSGRRESIGEG